MQDRCRFSGDYHSSPARRAWFPSVRFYWNIARIVYAAGKKALAGNYSAGDWTDSSRDVGIALENVGTGINIEGFSHVLGLQGPCVYIANHMSTLETFFLPCILQPVRNVTFVIKKSLLKYPYLGPILQSRNPVAVNRVNPRADLSLVLSEGREHLAAGTSLVIFPQGTRSRTVDEARFNSLASKLARRAGAPRHHQGYRLDTPKPFRSHPFRRAASHHGQRKRGTRGGRALYQKFFYGMVW